MKWFLLLGFLMFFGNIVIGLIVETATRIRPATKADVERFAGDVTE